MYSVRGKEADNMKRYKVEMQREGSVKYFFIRDMETLEIVLRYTADDM